ncbi:MAG: DNA repair protein RecO [Planctomycetota bacterium]|nr:DNA repair protein RecO [Planctomycetota bacterium]
MTIDKTRALVLNKTSYSNTSLVLIALTPDDGILSFIGKGFRKPPKRSWSPRDPIETFSEMEFTFYRSTTGLHSLSSATILEQFPAIRTSYDNFVCAAFAAGLTLDMAGSSDACDYSLLKAFWKALRRTDDNCRLTLAYWLRSLRRAGFLPSLQYCSSCSNELGKLATVASNGAGLLCANCSRSGRDSLNRGDIMNARFLLENRDIGKLEVRKASRKRLLNFLRIMTTTQVGRPPQLLDRVSKICDNIQ